MEINKKMKEFAKIFYKSPKWIKCRNAYIKNRIALDGGICEECGETVGYIVHHKKILTPDNINDPEITLNPDKLQYVCKSCHDKFEGHGIRNKRKHLCKFDEEGQPISLRKIDSPPVKKN